MLKYICDIMNEKNFKKNDEGFICVNCKKEVKPLIYSSRDHCPECLCSLHVDINPGDRKNSCKGLLVPFDIEKFKDTYKIIYKCQRCGMFHKNVMASDDNFDKIIKLSVKN